MRRRRLSAASVYTMVCVRRVAATGVPQAVPFDPWGAWCQLCRAGRVGEFMGGSVIVDMPEAEGLKGAVAM